VGVFCCWVRIRESGDVMKWIISHLLKRLRNLSRVILVYCLGHSIVAPDATQFRCSARFLSSNRSSMIALPKQELGVRGDHGNQ